MGDVYLARRRPAHCRPSMTSQLRLDIPASQRCLDIRPGNYCSAVQRPAQRPPWCLTGTVTSALAWDRKKCRMGEVGASSCARPRPQGARGTPAPCAERVGELLRSLPVAVQWGSGAGVGVGMLNRRGIGGAARLHRGHKRVGSRDSGERVQSVVAAGSDL
jgi:hypothetical protein